MKNFGKIVLLLILILPISVDDNENIWADKNKTNYDALSVAGYSDIGARNIVNSDTSAKEINKDIDN